MLDFAYLFIFLQKTSVKETRISKDDEYVENGKNPKIIFSVYDTAC